MNKIILSSLLLFGMLGAAYWGCCGIELSSNNIGLSENTMVKTVDSATPSEGRPTFQRIIEMLKNPETGEVNYELIRAGYKQAQKMKKAHLPTKDLDTSIEWEVLGPNNVGGRTRAFVIDKDDDQILYAGMVTGGVYKSVDGGANWDFKVNSVNSGATYVSTMTQDNDGALYVGINCWFEGSYVGGDFGTSAPGQGIFKSTDGGETYDRLDSTDPDNAGVQWETVNQLDNQVINGKSYLYAAISGRNAAGTILGGLYISSDDGASWTQADTPGNTNGVGYDVEVASNGKVYAAVGSGLYRSDNGIDDFVRLDGSGKALSSIGSRKVIAISDSDPNYVYLVHAPDCLDRVFQSRDGGDNFEVIGAVSAAFNPCAIAGETLLCQCSYDLAVDASPTDPGRIILGGISLWSWGENTGWSQIDKYSQSGLTDPNYVHSDKHGVFFHPTDGDIMYCTNDGGVFRTLNASTTYPSFQPINKGYTTFQCYGIAANHKGQVAAGAQDNGTFFISYDYNSSQTGIDVAGGDGIYTELSNIDSNIGFGGSQDGNINRTAGGFIAGGGSAGACIFQSCPCEVINVSNGQCASAFEEQCPGNLDGTCTLGEPLGTGGTEAFFVHPFILWEDTRLYYEIANWPYDGATVEPIPGNTSLDDLDAHNGQRFIFDTDPENATVSDNIYAEDEIVVTFDLETQKVINTPNDDKFRRGRFFTGTTENDGQFFIPQSSKRSKLWMSEDALKPGVTMQWLDLSHSRVLGTNNNVRPQGAGSALAATTDGDMVVLATGFGQILRVTGLNEKEYEAVVINGQPFNGQYITDININPNDDDNVIVTIGNAGPNGSNVYISDNFTAVNPSFTAVQGSGTTGLPDGPVFAGILLEGFSTPAGVINGDLLVGTMTGIYHGDRAGNTITWTQQNNGLGEVPVYRIKQEPMANFDEEKYHGVKVVYIGTHGRGMLRTTTLTATNVAGLSVPPEVYSIPSFTSVGLEEAVNVIEGIKIFPNPADITAQVEIDLKEAAQMQVNVYDLSGRVVKQQQTAQLTAGVHNFSIDVADLSSGTYIVVAESATQRLSKQLVVSH